MTRFADLLPKHPVAMTTLFRRCVLINYAIDPAALRSIVPDALDLPLVGGRGFVSVVVADMRSMRPAFLPERLGVSYAQVVYRVVVRYRGEPGVYFARSDAGTGDLHARLPRDGTAPLSPDSEFDSWAVAQSFLVELFQAFSPDPRTDRMRRVRIRRGPWGVSRVEPLEPVRCALLDGSPEFPAGSARLDSVLVADDIPYHWFPLEMEDANGTWRPGRMTMITRHRDPGPAGGA